MDSYEVGASVGAIVFSIVVAVFFLVVMWKIFAKAGKPGWAVLIPFYNIIVQLQIVNRPIWWIFLMFIPIANLVVAIIMTLDLAKSFGKSGGFGAGLIFLPIIFYPILAFGSAEYQKIER